MSKNKMSCLDYTNKISVSQNFITNQKLLERIVQLSSIKKGDTVLEVGTGKGHLTEVLCKKCGYLYSVEIDKGLFEKAKSRLSNIYNLQLIHGDFLNYKLPLKIEYKVFSNIPYFITTEIISKLTEAPNPPKDIWVVLEKGASKRFMGNPKETSKSLILKVNWEMKTLYHFKKDDFHPTPSVDSVLLHLSKKNNPDLDKADFYSFKKFVAHSLKYGLVSNGSLLTKKQVSMALKLANLPQLYKDEKILYIQWLCLFRCYKKFHRS